MPTTGGVVRMLMPLLRDWRQRGTLGAVEWVAMGVDHDAPHLRRDGLDVHFVALDETERKGYAAVKEHMWSLLNANPLTDAPFGDGGIPERAWVAFDAYQHRSARSLADARERMGGLDLAYVHDFQQVGVAGAWRGERVPMVFHLHTPFPSVLPPDWADYMLANLSRYDAVVVSTHRYAENLRAAGLDASIHVIHPFIDPSSYPRASERDVAAFRARFGIADDDRIILNVGRMDPMKGQDRLLRAMPRLLRDEPRTRLVLVGNGSFSSSKRGGLGLDKGKAWRARLEALAKELGVAHRVTFTGHLTDEDVSAAYEACEVFSLPSTREGFGLAAIEAWRHRRPVVVSDRAGVSELVEEGRNGASVDCADEGALAAALLDLLRDPDRARAMGDEGFLTSRVATMDVGRRALEELVNGVLEARPIVPA